MTTDVEPDWNVRFSAEEMVRSTAAVQRLDQARGVRLQRCFGTVYANGVRTRIQRQIPRVAKQAYLDWIWWHDCRVRDAERNR